MSLPERLMGLMNVARPFRAYVAGFPLFPLQDPYLSNGRIDLHPFVSKSLRYALFNPCS